MKNFKKILEKVNLWIKTRAFGSFVSRQKQKGRDWHPYEERLKFSFYTRDFMEKFNKILFERVGKE